jgi:uncharacterized membrane protein
MKQKGLKLPTMFLSERATVTDKTLLWVILITGVALRFYNYDSVPLVHDEISTLFRAYYNSYDSFGEFFDRATKSDVHPPGLLIFIRYWVRLFGDSPQLVKLPFVITGILSILLAYKIAAGWFNQTTALLTAAVISAGQFTITYSILARPYAFGLFFSLLLVYSQTKYFSRENKYGFWLLLFILSGIVCIYLHYFSVLFAFAVVVSGYFICPRNKLRVYIISSVIIALSFLPFLPILFFHLNETAGEPTWIGKPNLVFIGRFFFYINHYSIWLTSILLLLCGLLYFDLNKNSKNWTQKKWMAFGFFAFPFLVGFLISIYAFPVLEFSGLIFGFAYLPMFIFSSGKELRPAVKSIAVLVFLTANVLTLTIERKHFDLFYNQEIDKLNKEVEASSKLVGHSCNYFMNVAGYFIKYYSGKVQHPNMTVLSVPGKDYNHYMENLLKHLI